MFRRAVFAGVGVILLSSGGFAQPSEQGTAGEAKAVLERAVEAVKADKEKALEMFNKGEGGFKDRDLYVFCVNASDGMETAHPTHKGKKITEIKDAKGFPFGEEIMRTATEGKISEITYMWPRPGADVPVEKVTFYTKVSDQICAVGYYK
jgi:signal transduction histidine kinase